MISKPLEYYLSLPYTIEVIRENDEDNPGWVARVAELPGCITQADTFEELGEMIEDAMRIWLQSALEDDIAIPEPRLEDSYSGKFVVRMPRSLHREVAEAALHEEVSLNLWVTTQLGKAVGQTVSRGSYAERIRVETEIIQLNPSIPWKNLSIQARRLLIANGFSDEVQEITEELFAAWIENHLDQIQAATQGFDYPEALTYIHVLREALEQICSVSPIVKTYCHALMLFEKQTLVAYRMHQGVVEQSRIHERIMAEVRESTEVITAYQVNETQLDEKDNFEFSYPKTTTSDTSKKSLW